MSLPDSSDELSVCSFCWNSDSFGAGHYDTIDGSFSVSTFRLTEFCLVVDHVITRFKPSHFLIPSNAPEDAVQVLSERSVNLVIRKQSDFSFKFGMTALNSVFFTVPQEEQNLIRTAAASKILDISSNVVIGAIASILQFCSGRQIIISSFRSLNIPNGLTLSARAFSELQIFAADPHPSIHNACFSKDGLSLFAYMNRCSTAMGRSTLRQWFLMTNSDMDSIHSRHEIVAYFIRPETHPFVNELTSKMETLPEIRHFLVRLQNGTMKQSQWQRLHRGLIQCSELSQLIHNSLFLRDNSLFEALGSHSDELHRLAVEIDSTLYLKSPKKEIRVRDECDPELTEFRRIYADLDKTMTDSARTIIRSLPPHSGVSSLSVVFVPHQGFFATLPRPAPPLPVGFAFAFDTDTHVYCRSPETSALDDTFGDIHESILRRELHIIVGLSDRLLSFSHILTSVWESLGVLDSLCSLAVVAVEANYVRPILTDSGGLSITNGRHPLLERITDRFIPNSTVTDPARVHIVTGPNSSGKSVYLKQIGLIVFLAHIGSFVPADRAVIPVADSLLTLFHGADTRGQPFESAFTADVRRICECLAKATARSIVLIDEFGRASASGDGAALCATFLRTVAAKGGDAPIVFLSTHFREIVERGLMPQTVARCEMEVRMETNETLLFLYRVVTNHASGGESFGIECAERAGLEKGIVERARVIAKCYRSGEEIPQNEECIDRIAEERVRTALALFFAWDGESNPRALLARIERAFAGDPQ
jgi:DNA mismatch repair protein MSH5